MIYSAIIDLLLASMIYFYGRKHEATKWAVLFLFFAGLGSFSDVAQAPVWHSLFFFILQACTPYGFIMFSIVYSETAIPRVKNIFACALALPIITTLLITPMKPDIQMDFLLLLFWAVPYYLAGCFLVIYAYLKEKNPLKRRNRLITACFIVPPVIMIVVVNHFERAVHTFGSYRYISLFVVIAFAVFIVSAIRFGVLGVRIKFEKQLHDQTIKGIVSGAAMLNHAMKNHITNIDMLTGRLKEHVQNRLHEQADEDIAVIQAETRQMMHMVKRIKKHIEDIEIVEGPASLSDIVAQALLSNRYLLEHKRISVLTDYSLPCNLICDKLHLQEVFANLIRNAVEAVEMDNGMLAIRIHESKKDFLVDFSNNGRGIDKETRAQLFEPFFSTKHHEDNFGLGLTYCYLIMQKHGGSIDVSSQQAGATFSIHLPKTRRA
ncbi:ATP-binding protein [Paenibacillus sepulcri]|uniref:histidine kinase n=1 Tax=Paenibacillus sepulcri TaxID=359917 RepID=A0ABS7CAE2_9BACL|nr:HAMP domain-containing histidine kinase [Paenibacillus sepulcri]